MYNYNVEFLFLKISSIFNRWGLEIKNHKSINQKIVMKGLNMKIT